MTGPLGLLVGFATLKDYGVDKVFELERDNTDSSQRNIVYLVHGEKAGPVQAVAGESKPSYGTHKDIARLHASTLRFQPKLPTATYLEHALI